MRSILEGVCYSLKDGLEIIAESGCSAYLHPAFRRRREERASGIRCSRISSKRHVTTLETQEGSAYGAALLALHRDRRIWRVRVKLCDRAIKESVVKDPEPDAVKAYEARYQVFHSLYPALRPAYRAISELDE